MEFSKLEQSLHRVLEVMCYLFLDFVSTSFPNFSLTDMFPLSALEYWYSSINIIHFSSNKPTPKFHLSAIVLWAPCIYNFSLWELVSWCTFLLAFWKLLNIGYPIFIMSLSCFYYLSHKFFILTNLINSHLKLYFFEVIFLQTMSSLPVCSIQVSLLSEVVQLA